MCKELSDDRYIRYILNFYDEKSQEVVEASEPDTTVLLWNTQYDLHGRENEYWIGLVKCVTIGVALDELE